MQKCGRIWSRNPLRRRWKKKWKSPPRSKVWGYRRFLWPPVPHLVNTAGTLIVHVPAIFVMFTKLECASGTIRTTGTGQTQISRVSIVVLDIEVDRVKEQLHLSGVVYTPNVLQHLLSVGAVHTKGCHLH